VRVFGRQIALALGRLREAGVVHRDIKSENILIQGGRCKLGDFGFAVEAGKLAEGKVFNLGSPLYMSI
jgi:serine/threonine protein kinase